MASLLSYEPTNKKHGKCNATLKLNKFSRFNQLPVEIRLEIWRQTIQPHNIALSPGTIRHWQFRYRFNRFFPVALHVCRESRNEILPKYTCISLIPNRHYETLSPPRRYVNFAVDTFIFPDLEYGLESFFAVIGKQSQHIQSIVVGTDIYGNIRERDIKLLSELPHLHSLRIHLGGIGVNKELLVFDPTIAHELRMDSAPPSYCWSSLLEAFRSKIARHWPRELLPLKGFSSLDNGCEPQYTNKKTIYVGEFRDWMKPE